MVDAKTGGDIWKVNKGKMNVFVANFVEDQNGDNVSDVVASYSSLEGVCKCKLYECLNANLPQKKLAVTSCYSTEKLDRN